MAKHYSKKGALKYAAVALACVSVFSLAGCSACNPDDNKDDDKTTSKEDTQLLKNGNFEFFDVPAQKKDENPPVYLINTPNSWSKGGTSSYTMSGIIGTSDEAWKKITADDLADKLDANNALDSSASGYKDAYVDYNGMKSSDLLYKDTYGVLNPDKESETDKSFIENPLTHNIFKKSDGTPYLVNDKGEEQTVYVDENGDYYLEKNKDEYSQPTGHVLMLHNYATAHNGIAQNYSSVNIELPANTAAEVSVWVKTSNLSFHQGTEVKQDRGANIYVSHTAGSSNLNDFAITCINTEKLIKEGKAEDKYNGWVEYTVYINACDFASSTVTLKLGLGETDYTVEGYAFFDDVTVKKYIDLDDSTYSDNKADIEKSNASCTLTSDASEKKFKADSYSRNGGTITDKRYSESFHYLVDLASEKAYDEVTFGGIVKAGLTVDSDNYVSSTDTANINKIGFTSTEAIGNAKLPKEFKALKNGLDTSSDLLAYVKAGYDFTGKTDYSEKLNTALDSAKDLPKLDAGTNDNLIVMLSAYGAAYTSSFELTAAKESYQIISFWVKTSDMKGSTAATIKLIEKDNDTNAASITVDSNNAVKTDIDADNKDIYNGWVQCFFFVHNEMEEAKTLNVEFSFGNTVIKDTNVTSYRAGWAALANMQTLDVDKDVYAYTGSGSFTGSLTINEENTVKKPSVFDEAYGSQSHEIRNGMVNPSTYKGVNGASSSVMNNGHVSIPFDDINKNTNAGLINKDYVDNYAAQDWFKNLLTNFNASNTDAIDNWNQVFGTKSVQPLVINNKLRDDYVWKKDANKDTYTNYYIKNDDGKFVKASGEFDEKQTYYSLEKVLNYGFIGNDKTVASDSYATISVRVRVSKGAVAYVYLVDASTEKNVLGISTPTYSFWYDEDGNVLKGEPDEKWSLAEKRANIAYTLRQDGLYENDKGELFANTYNYSKLYIDNITYYTKDGSYSIDELVDGVTYYADAACTTEANHYLVTSKDIKIYKYENGNYHYIADGKVLKDAVKPFDPAYKRYSSLSEQYVQVINGNDTNEWVTVNFVIHAGSESKAYRLELWSGERDKLTTDGNNEGASIIFDYSYTSVGDDNLRNEYENEIIKAYQRLLDSKNLLKNIATSEENIRYYEELVKSYEGKEISSAEIEAIQNSYTAHYYTYSLYDSDSFQPFNKDVVSAESTGYDYSVSDYSESLAYLKVKDGNTYTIFTDYATVNQSISLDASTDDDDDDTDDDDKDNNTNVWLLASSILLVVALLFAMLAIFVRDALKKARRNKTTANNKYNKHRTERYIRKLGIKKEEFEETENTVTNDAKVEETPVEEVPEETVEDIPVEEVPETSVEETEPAEETTETTTEENSEE